MPRLQRKSFATPDEVRTFAHGRVDVIVLDEIAIGRFALQPGWRWSQDVAPVVGTRSCQNRHIGYVTVGSLQVTMDDGTELVIRAGDGYEIPPGHDVLVIGDEPFECIEFTSAHTFGLAPEELGERFLATVLFSDIVGSTAMLERLGDHAWASLLQEHNVRIRAAIDRFDGTAKALRAGALMDPAVADPALESLVARVASIHPIDVRLEVQLAYENDAHPTRLSSDVEDTLYRVVQEALNNVVKHAEASSVEVSIVERGDCIDLVVKDNGVGLATATSRSGGFGLIGIRERVELVGGSFAIGDGDGGGTELRASIPAPRRQQPAMPGA